MSLIYALNNNSNTIKLGIDTEENIKAPVHIIDDLRIYKGITGSMVLEAPVVEATIIETDSINAISGVFTSAINPLLNTTDIDINGNLNMSNYQLDVGSIYANGTTGAINQTLSKNSENILTWSDPATPPTPTLAQVLTAGNTANTNINMNLNQIQNCSTLRVNNMNNVSGTGQINMNCNLNFGNPAQSMIFCGRVNTTDLDSSAQITLGRAPNRFTGANSFAYNYINNSNIIRSDSVADLINFHDIKSNQGKISIVNSSDIDQFSADDTGLIIGNELRTSKLNIPSLTPTAGQVLASSDANGTLYWKDDATADVSQWSTFPAVSNVNISNYGITGANNINSLSSTTNSITTQTGQNGTLLLDSFVNITNQLQAQTNIRTKALYMDRASQFQGSFIQMFDKNNNPSISLIADDASGLINCGQLNPSYKPERTLYVSGNNTNPTPTGSFENPFSTIQSAINYAESQYNNTYWFINVQAGTYTENLTITKKIYINGCNPSNPDAGGVGCQITGNITLAMDSNDADMFNNGVFLSNLFITGSIEDNSASIARHLLVLTDCHMYQDSGSGRLIHYNPGATDGRLWLFNSKFLEQSTTATSPIIEIDNGMLKMYQCQVSGAGNENILKLGGTARIDNITLCSFTSNTDSTTAEPIVELSSTGAVLTFFQCAFIYSNSANKSASSNSSALLLNNSTIGFYPTINIQNCSFNLLGTSPTTNYTIQDTNFGTAKQGIIIIYGNNSLINTAFQIRGTYNVNKFSNQTSDSLKTPLLDTTNIYANNSVGTAGQFLQKDGSNNLVWGAGGGGSSSTLADVLNNGNTASQNIDMNNFGITGANSINTVSLITNDININGNTGAISQVLGKDNLNNLAWLDQSGGGGGAFSNPRSLYVDAGNTSSGDGTINNPFNTIQTAVDYGEVNFDVNNYWTIFVANGSYAGFNITKPRIYIQGYNKVSNYSISTDAPCKITSDVRLSIQTAGGTNSIVGISNIYFQNSSIYDNSTLGASNQNYNLYLNNVQMETTITKDYLINLNPNSGVNLYIDSCRFSYIHTSALTGSSMIRHAMNFSVANIQNSVFNTTQNNRMIEMAGASIGTFEEIKNCVFTNSTNATAVLPMIQGSTNRSNPNSITYNQFLFTNTTARNANSRCILLAASTFQLQCTLAFNYFNLGGFLVSNSFVAGDGSAGTVNGCCFNYYGNSSGITFASGVATNWTNIIEGVEGQGKRAILGVS